MCHFVPNYFYCFCEILFELVYSWESCRKNKKDEHFIETQCSCEHVFNLTIFITDDMTVQTVKVVHHVQHINRFKVCSDLLVAYNTIQCICCVRR